MVRPKFHTDSFNKMWLVIVLSSTQFYIIIQLIQQNKSTWDLGEFINQIFICENCLLEFVSLTDKVKVEQNLDLALYNSKYNIRNSNRHFTKQIGLDGVLFVHILSLCQNPFNF